MTVINIDEEKLINEGRALSKAMLRTLAETIDERVPVNDQEKATLVLLIAQMVLCDTLIAISNDRAHALAGMNMATSQITDNLNKYYNQVN